MSKHGLSTIFQSEAAEKQVPLSADERRVLEGELRETKRRLASPGPAVLFPTLVGGITGLATLCLAVGEANFGGGIDLGGTAAVLGTEAAVAVLPWVGRALRNASRRKSAAEIREALEYGRRPANPFHGLPAATKELTHT